VNRGKYLLTVQSSNTAWFNYHGKTKSKRVAKDLRILRSGSGALRLSFVVYADSDIKTIADLKGRRITSDFGGHAAINPIVTATLGYAGLSWKDVTPVPVAGALESPRALGADRVEAAWASLGMPVVREIHAKKKVRYISIDKSAKSLEYLRKNVFPGLRLVTMPPIKRFGLTAPTTLITSDSYLITSKNADPETVMEVMNGAVGGQRGSEEGAFLAAWLHQEERRDRSADDPLSQDGDRVLQVEGPVDRRGRRRQRQGHAVDTGVEPNSRPSPARRVAGSAVLFWARPSGRRARPPVKYGSATLDPRHAPLLTVRRCGNRHPEGGRENDQAAMLMAVVAMGRACPTPS
jgi:hypothetical protein